MLSAHNLTRDIAGRIVAYTSVGFCKLLSSDRKWAMREASDGRTVTDTDSYAFFMPILIADERKTEASQKHHASHYLFSAHFYGIRCKCPPNTTATSISLSHITTILNLQMTHQQM